jgi:hydroxypyruvate isomerase
MTKFSANLGFLWSDLPLPEAIHAAKVAGFDAVECHWPYDVPAADTLAALNETGLNLSLNLDFGYFQTVSVMLKSSSFVDGVRFPV